MYMPSPLTRIKLIVLTISDDSEDVRELLTVASKLQIVITEF